VARILQDRLKLLLWYRPERQGDYVYGAQLKLDAVIKSLEEAVQLEESVGQQVCAALLNEDSMPLAQSVAGFQTNWKQPFAGAEIGDLLPGWKIGVYLRNPNQVQHASRYLKLILSMVILLALLAIGVGSWLIARELRREIKLAQSRTDFVSNVSHELKTPLTSIRMFSELLAEGKILDPHKQKEYLRVISTEATRLTRLINNVLDFARMERGNKVYQREPLNLTEVVGEAVETCRPQFEAKAFELKCLMPEEGPAILGDKDAIAQVVMNLLSNAEKYAGTGREVEIEVASRSGKAVVAVRDRGPGVPETLREKIFQQFFRGEDSLSSGIPGSGLGLTLARQIIRAHGGELYCRARGGGGSEFVFEVPCTPS
jgi:signal transduction histidine kinase